MNLTDRVVILTGATAGIGRATAFELGAAGSKLALVARNEPALAQLVSALAGLGVQAVALPADMGDTAQARRLVEQTWHHFGSLDIVINNAALGLRDNIADLSEVEARRTMDVNYFGPLVLIQSALPFLRANPAGGMIVNISSIVGRRAMPGIGHYCAGKAALEKMADSLRLEVAGDNIRVCTIYPGVTRTDFNKHSLGRSRTGRDRVSGVPPERVAQAIARAIQREQRDGFITLFDRAFVAASTLWPRFMDRLLSGYLKPGHRSKP
jgi:NAD(P)-dependent dehydrogenase (short-subunit alcohol dehydrogenase family)